MALFAVNDGGDKMRTYKVLIGIAGLLVSTAASAAVLPGYAGFPSPFSDLDAWSQNEGRLDFALQDTDWHYFVIPIAVKESASGASLTVKWQHGTYCPAPPALCLGAGSAEGRVTTFSEDGTITGSPPWDSTVGTAVTQTVSVPAGGSAIFRVRMKADAGSPCLHYISRVVSSGAAAL
jgi:hypothetical protein